MNYDQLIAEWKGKQVTAYGGECVALVAEYCHENSKPIVWGNAIDWANNPVMLSAFDWIVNNPSDLHQIPTRGDIIIWNANLPGSGGYGHIAIWDMVTSPGNFQSFDQNWGGAVAHFQQHNWQYVLGWYHPKAVPPTPAPHPDPAPANPILPPAPAPEPTVLPDLTNQVPSDNPTTPPPSPAPVENSTPVVLSPASAGQGTLPPALSTPVKVALGALLALIAALIAWIR